MHLQMTVVWENGGHAPVEVLVDAPPGSTGAHLADGLRSLLEPTGSSHPAHPARHLRVTGAPVLDDDLLGEGALVDGAVLTVAGARGPEHRPEPRAVTPGPLSLAVVSGPDAGRELPLTTGTVTLGRGGAADLTVADPDLSRSHALLTVDVDGVRLTDAGSTNGVRVDGSPLPPAGLRVEAHHTVAAGSSRLQVRGPSRRPAAVGPARDGVRAVNRSPRLARPRRPQTFTLPQEPQSPRRTRLPWVAMLAPLPVGVVLALFFTPAMLAFALMSPLMMGATALSDRVQGRRSYAAQLAEHARAAERVRAAAAAAVTEERHSRHRALPDPAEVLAIATTPSTRLWERRRADPDVLEVRLGTWTARTQVRLASVGGHEPEVLEAPEAPCGVALDTVGVLGLAGRRPTTEAVARNLVGQVATLHSPHDVDIWVLAARPEDLAAWQWVTRLPHNRCRDRARRIACLATDSAATGTAVDELLATVHDRLPTPSPPGPWQGARAIVVLAGAGDLREVPGMATLLERGPAAGVVFIALDLDRGRLPIECRAVVEAVPRGSHATSWHLTTPDEPGGHGLVVDQVGPWWADRLSRALAPLRDATPEEACAALPDTARLTDLLPFDALDPRAVAQQWRTCPATTRVPVGVSTGGPHLVDLRRDGPHVLVGGTTGSGKSEFLRTLVAGLAAANRPDRLAFVLVDYKGGAAFRECAALPHTAGLVTDLDAHLTARALTSLGAELRRRETLFASVGARDLDEWEQRHTADHPPVPRLVIVVDEFRALAEEFPDFIAGLVRIAAVGRSLGVHLVLATQRPAGVVSADIKANVSLRVALRVRDRADSDDVIDTPDAAGISERTPGRAFARSGSEPPQAFQTALVADVSRPDHHPPLRVTAVDWGSAVALGPGPTHGAGSRPQGEPSGGPAGAPSDLSALVASVRDAADALGIVPAPSPWLPPLPDALGVESLRPAATSDGWAVPVGVADRPGEQLQEPLTWDLRVPGHWAAIGGAGSGRTGFLRLLAREAARRLGPAQLHLYAVDGGREELRALTRLPHTGAVVPRDDHGRLERLVRRLEADVARRQQLHDGHRAEATMLLLVDDWDLVTRDLDTVDHGALTERLVRLLREGSAVGLRAAVAGDRSLLFGATASLFSERLVLRLADPADAVLAGLSRTALPDLQPPGRAVLASDGTVVQLAREASGRVGGDLGAGPAHVGMESQVSTDSKVGTDRGLASPVRDAGELPLRVEPLPRHVTLDDVFAQEQGGAVRTGDAWSADVLVGRGAGAQATGGQVTAGVVTLGLGGDDVRPVGLDPRVDGPLWLVAGPSRGGKSTALRSIGESLLRGGQPLAVVSGRPGPLDDLRGRAGVVCFATPDDADALVAAYRDQAWLAVVVDDADQVLDTPVDPVLRELVRAARQGHGIVVCAAGTQALLTQYRGPAVEVARSQTGLLLGPRGLADGELFGLSGTRRTAPSDRVPGRGLLVTASDAVEVQVATPHPPAQGRGQRPGVRQPLRAEQPLGGTQHLGREQRPA